MPSGGHKKYDLALIEDRGDDSDVRQVAAPRQLGVVAHQHVALLNAFIFARALRVIPQLHDHGHVLTLEQLFARVYMERSARALWVMPQTQDGGWVLTVDQLFFRFCGERPASCLSCMRSPGEQ